MSDSYVTARKAAEILDVNIEVVRRWCRNGILPCRRLGRTIRIPRSAL